MAQPSPDRRTRKEMLEDLLKHIEKDFNTDKQKACKKLSDIERDGKYQELLSRHLDLYYQFIILQRDCT